MSGPSISREELRPLSPWVTLVEREVEGLAGGEHPAVYHAMKVADYVTIVARTEDDLYPVIRQYRPAVRQFTWELPAGLIDPSETPEEAGVRELKEETGLIAASVQCCGSFLSDSGRIDNRIHIFSVLANRPAPDFKCEPGIDVAYWKLAEIQRAIGDGRFAHLPHVAAFLLVQSAMTAPTA